MRRTAPRASGIGSRRSVERTGFRYPIINIVQHHFINADLIILDPPESMGQDFFVHLNFLQFEPGIRPIWAQLGPK